MDDMIVYGMVAGPYRSRENALKDLEWNVLFDAFEVKDVVRDDEGDFVSARDRDGHSIELVRDEVAGELYIVVVMRHERMSDGGFSVFYEEMKKDLRMIRRRWKGLKWTPAVFSATPGEFYRRVRYGA